MFGGGCIINLDKDTVKLKAQLSLVRVWYHTALLQDYVKASLCPFNGLTESGTQKHFIIYHFFQSFYLFNSFVCFETTPVELREPRREVVWVSFGQLTEKSNVTAQEHRVLFHAKLPLEPPWCSSEPSGRCWAIL